MTEPRDPNEPGWGAPQQPQQPQWGGQPPPPGWGAPPPDYGQPPPGYGQPPPYGAPPPYGVPGNPYGPGPYGGPTPYGYYSAEPPTDGKAVGALVAAILSWLFCPIIPAVVALVLAGQSTRAINASGGRLKGAGLNTAAKITAWANIVIVGLLIAIFVGFAVTTSETTTVVEYGLSAR